MITIKRNTTPTLPIVVEVPFENIRKIEFVFKRKIDPTSPALVKRKYSIDSAEGIPIREGEDNSKEFTVLMKLKAKETAELLAGESYMDTLIVFKDGTIPDTEIIPAKIKETLFMEVYDDDEGENQE